MTSRQVFQSFWTGPLTMMEILSMRSFLANGHEFHLYCYEDLAGADGSDVAEGAAIPPGVVLHDAREILPHSQLARFRCPQQFSDFFRIALLLHRGGWYTDLDNICLRPFDDPAFPLANSSYCFYRDHDETTVTLALAKAPAGSDFLEAAYDQINLMPASRLDELPWQAIGAGLIPHIVNAFGLIDAVPRGYLFDPIHWERAKQVVDPEAKFDLSRSWSCHLFHAAWNRGPEDRSGKGFDLMRVDGDVVLNTDATYPEGSLYELLKRKYGI